MPSVSNEPCGHSDQSIQQNRHKIISVSLQN